MHPAAPVPAVALLGAARHCDVRGPAPDPFKGPPPPCAKCAGSSAGLGFCPGTQPSWQRRSLSAPERAARPCLSAVAEPPPPVARSRAGCCSHSPDRRVWSIESPVCPESATPHPARRAPGVNRAEGGWQPPGWRRAAKRRQRRNLLLGKKLNCWRVSWAS